MEYYEESKGVPPEGDVVARNICWGGAWVRSGWHNDAVKWLQISDNLVDVDPLFVAAARRMVDEYGLVQGVCGAPGFARQD